MGLMGEIIVAIIVGLLSGALGSVLGPVAAHFLRRRERKEEREREIQRELREMIGERLQDCGRERGVAFRIHADMRFLRASAADAYNRAMAQQWAERRDRPRQRWEPYRITDSKLRSLVEEFHDRLLEFESHLSSVMTTGLEEWWAGVPQRERKLMELDRQITLRLDELRW
jgi:hypothetical protein